MAKSIGLMYAVRHKPTGWCLPRPTGHMNRGGSFVEPTERIEGKLNTYPRLFETQRAAKNYLVQWLRGKHHAIKEYESDDYGRMYYYTAGAEVEAEPGRVREDMEIIVVNLMVE